MNTKLVLKVVMLVIALGGVLYGIQALKSPEFARRSQEPDSALSLLVGSDARPLNWCPLQTTKVELLSDEGAVRKTLQDLREISAVCEIMIGGVNQDQLSQASFAVRIRAYNSAKEERTLEQAKGATLFRVQGLPFSSPMLEKVLQRSQQPDSN